MPHRTLIAQQLARFFSVLSHPVRIRIIAELRNSELCVNSLQEILGISHSGVSQHLATLRAHRLIKEHRRGRNVFYRLCSPEMVTWLVDGITFITPDNSDEERLRTAAAMAKEQWSDPIDDRLLFEYEALNK
ncbi:MAG: metalloregulator ArsR/SmtB family transcription factor [Candidatus Melainabacteria bacterium]|nr:metalloregulator ArsR/SmtB family transcription factor [Candidatus Melainabacteria bacterium]